MALEIVNDLPSLPSLDLTILPDVFAICRLSPDSAVPLPSPAPSFLSLTVTPQEISVVCVESDAPHDSRVEPGWHCLRFEGPFPFSQTGVLVSVAAPLAQAGIGIFVVSTFDTDYLLIKATDGPRAVVALTAAGHRVHSAPA